MSSEYLRWLKYIIIPISGVMETQLDVLVSHENITTHNDFVHMAANLNYTTDPCGNISNSCSWPCIGNKKWTYFIGYHSHEQDIVESSLKIN